MYTGETWRLGRRPALDGLRGVAVLMVLAAHFGIPRLNSTSAGSAGVTVFFTLSGFLITTLLLQEHARTGGLARGCFYLRRARRLVPALLVCIVLAVVLELAIFGRITDPDIVVGGLTYTANFAMMDNHWHEPTFLGNLWSLGIEEQFYLAWPFVVLLLVRLNRIRALTVLLYASGVAVALRALVWDGGAGKVRLWMGIDTRSDALLIGCLLALWMRGRQERPACWAWGLAGGAVLLSVLPWRLTGDQAATAIQMPLYVSLATAALIYSAVTRPRHRFLGSRALRYVGSRSYGWYLYQAPIQTALIVLHGRTMLSAWLVVLPLTVIVAEVSWRYVEQPVQRRRSAEVLTSDVRGGEVQRASRILKDGALDVVPGT